MTEYFYDDSKKELPSDQLHRLFLLAGWSDGSESSEILDKFNLPFSNSTLVISAWQDDRLIGAVRVLSDKIVRSVIYDLVVDPEFQGKGIGRELIIRCIQQYPKSEWLVQTGKYTIDFYKKMGFDKYKNSTLRIPSKWF